MALQAGSAYSSYALDLRPLRASITSAKRELSDFKAFADKTLAGASPGAGGGAGGGRGAGGASAGGAGAGARNAADEALRLAQARARLAQASGDSANAEQILSNALANSTGASERASLAAQTQAARLQNAKTLANEFSEGLKSGFLGIVGPAAAASAAIGALSQVPALIQAGAAAEATRASFDKLAQSVGTTGDALLTGLRAAAQGTVSDAQLIQSANSGILLTSGKLAKDLPRLLEIARASAQATGDDVGFVFDSLVKGIARGSPQIIDNAKITLDAAGAFDAYAKSVGKTSDQLTREEQQQATLNAVLAAGTDIIAKTGGAAETNAARLARLSVAGENIKSAYGQSLANTIGPTVELLGRIGAAGSAAGDGAAAGSTQVAAFRQQFADSVPVIGQFLSGVREVNALLGGSAGAAAQATSAAAAQQAAASQQVAAANAEEISVKQTLVSANLAAAQASAQNALTMDAERAAAANTSAAVLALRDANTLNTQATVDQIAQQQASQLQGQQLANVQATLASLGSAVAGGFQTAGSAALVLANQYGIAYNSALALIQAQATLAQKQVAIAALADQRAGERSGGAVRTAKEQTDLANAARASARAQEAATTASARYQQQLGNFGPAIANAQKELDQIPKNTAAYYDKLTEIDRLKSQQRAAQQRGAGSARVGAAAKINNQLLDNEEKTQQKLEDLAREHGQNVLRIEGEFQKKSLEQQRANEVSKRQSRADFYDALTSATKDLGQQEAQRLSADYEAAYAKAQQLAQSGQAKLAADYLAFKEQQIRAEIEFQQQLAEARKQGDDAEVARLEAIHKLRQDAAAEQEKQLLEGGDANVKTRDEQLAEEQKRFEEAQGKVETASDRATDRLVTNAERRGAALDAENAKLREQQQIYDRMGAPAAPPGVTTPPPPTTTGATGAAPGAATGGEQIWRVFDSGVVDAINAQTAALSGKLDDVITAVGDVGARVSNVERAVNGLSGRFAN